MHEFIEGAATRRQWGKNLASFILVVPSATDDIIHEVKSEVAVNLGGPQDGRCVWDIIASFLVVKCTKENCCCPSQHAGMLELPLVLQEFSSATFG